MYPTIPINQIERLPLKWKLDTDKVKQLAKSIQEDGLLINPITLRQQDDHYDLISGAHRFEACKSLLWEEIPANVITIDGLRAELIQIDENLMRGTLTSLYAGQHWKRRKEILQSLGLWREQGKHSSLTVSDEGTKDISKKTDKSAATIRRLVHIAESIPDYLQDAIQYTELAESTRGLVDLARRPEDEQEEIVTIYLADQSKMPAHKKIGFAISEVKKDKKMRALAESANESQMTHDIRYLSSWPLNTIHKSFSEDLLNSIPQNSVDIIFTDPPYSQEFRTQYKNLAQIASYSLKEGGLLFTYAGKSHLPDIIGAFELLFNLRYVWACAVFHPFSKQQMFKYRIFGNWRPILIYSKGDYPEDTEWIQDVIRGERDKEHHAWQQDLEAPLYYLKAFATPGCIIMDPFAGSGTTLLAAEQLGLDFIGFDADPSAVEVANMRLAKHNRDSEEKEG